jgi:hypothetical protein
MVCNINQSINLFEMDQILLNPFTKRKILDIDMANTRRGLLSAAHCHTTVVVLICHVGGFLGDVEAPKDTPDKERHPADTASGHKFRLGSRERNRGLELGFVGNRVTGKLNTDTAKGASGLDTCEPV